MIRNIPANPLLSETQKEFLFKIFKYNMVEAITFLEDHFNIANNIVTLEFANVGMAMKFNIQIQEDQEYIFNQSKTLKIVYTNNDYYIFGEVNTEVL